MTVWLCNRKTLKKKCQAYGQICDSSHENSKAVESREVPPPRETAAYSGYLDSPWMDINKKELKAGIRRTPSASRVDGPSRLPASQQIEHALKLSLGIIEVSGNPNVLPPRTVGTQRGIDS